MNFRTSLPLRRAKYDVVPCAHGRPKKPHQCPEHAATVALNAHDLQSLHLPLRLRSLAAERLVGATKCSYGENNFHASVAPSRRCSWSHSSTWELGSARTRRETHRVATFPSWKRGWSDSRANNPSLAADACMDEGRPRLRQHSVAAHDRMRRSTRAALKGHLGGWGRGGRVVRRQPTRSICCLTREAADDREASISSMRIKNARRASCPGKAHAGPAEPSISPVRAP